MKAKPQIRTDETTWAPMTVVIYKTREVYPIVVYIHSAQAIILHFKNLGHFILDTCSKRAGTDIMCLIACGWYEI